ncbi:GNAT family N-acetyltransferase [soil metagenome]
MTDAAGGGAGGPPSLQISDAPEQGRYEARLEGEDGPAAVVEYRLGSGWIAFLHTEVRADLEGRGVGGWVAAGVIEAARDRGLKVIPSCPFIAAWLARHPEHHDILLHPLERR